MQGMKIVTKELVAGILVGSILASMGTAYAMTSLGGFRSPSEVCSKESGAWRRGTGRLGGEVIREMSRRFELCTGDMGVEAWFVPEEQLP